MNILSVFPYDTVMYPSAAASQIPVKSRNFVSLSQYALASYYRNYILVSIYYSVSLDKSNLLNITLKKYEANKYIS